MIPFTCGLKPTELFDPNLLSSLVTNGLVNRDNTNMAKVLAKHKNKSNPWSLLLNPINIMTRLWKLLGRGMAWLRTTLTIKAPSQMFWIGVIAFLFSYSSYKFLWRIKSNLRSYFRLDLDAYQRDAINYQAPSRLALSPLKIFGWWNNPTLIGVEKLLPYLQLNYPIGPESSQVMNGVALFKDGFVPFGEYIKTNADLSTTITPAPVSFAVPAPVTAVVVETIKKGGVGDGSLVAGVAATTKTSTSMAPTTHMDDEKDDISRPSTRGSIPKQQRSGNNNNKSKDNNNNNHQDLTTPTSKHPTSTIAPLINEPYSPTSPIFNNMHLSSNAHPDTIVLPPYSPITATSLLPDRIGRTFIDPNLTNNDDDRDVINGNGQFDYQEGIGERLTKGNGGDDFSIVGSQKASTIFRRAFLSQRRGSGIDGDGGDITHTTTSANPIILNSNGGNGGITTPPPTTTTLAQNAKTIFAQSYNNITRLLSPSNTATKSTTVLAEMGSSGGVGGGQHHHSHVDQHGPTTKITSTHFNSTTTATSNNHINNKSSATTDKNNNNSAPNHFKSANNRQQPHQQKHLNQPYLDPATGQLFDDIYIPPLGQLPIALPIQCPKYSPAPTWRGQLLDIDHKPRTIMFVANHTVMGGDMMSFQWSISDVFNIFPRGLAHRGHFNFPIWSQLFHYAGAVVGTRETAGGLLERGCPTVVFPGGGREIMRKVDERPYDLYWEQRVGFVKIAIQHNAVIVPISLVGGPEGLHHLGDLSFQWLYGCYRPQHVTIPLSPVEKFQTEIKLITIRAEQMLMAGYWSETKARDWGDEMIERLDNAFERDYPRDYKDYIHYHTIGLDLGVNGDVGAGKSGKADCLSSGWDRDHSNHPNPQGGGNINNTIGGNNNTNNNSANKSGRRRPSSSTTTTTTTPHLKQFGPQNIADDDDDDQSESTTNRQTNRKTNLTTASPPPAAIIGLYGMDIVSSDPSEEPSIVSMKNNINNTPTTTPTNPNSSTPLSLQQLPLPTVKPDSHTPLHAIFSEGQPDTYNQRSHYNQYDGSLSIATRATAATTTTTTAATCHGDEHYLALSTANNPSQPLVAPSILSPQASPTAFTAAELAQRLYGTDAPNGGMRTTNLFHHLASPTNNNNMNNNNNNSIPPTTIYPQPNNILPIDDNGAALRKFVNGNSETLPKIIQPHVSKNLAVSLPISFPSPNPFKWQRHYFVIGDPIDAADYHGLEEDETAVRHLRDRVKAELELGIQNGLKYQQIDPNRYTLDRWGKWVKSMFGM